MTTTSRSNHRQLIFLIGKQRAGKDTVADYLVRKYGFKKAALADKLKEVASDLFQMEGKDRGLLIELGTKMREIDPDVWIKWLWNKHGHEERLVIPDVRFHNEYEFFMARGGKAVRVEADIVSRAMRPGYDEEFENHPTETQLLDMPVDFVIRNDYGIHYLFEEIHHMMLTFWIKDKEAGLL